MLPLLSRGLVFLWAAVFPWHDHSKARFFFFLKMPHLGKGTAVDWLKAQRPFIMTTIIYNVPEIIIVPTYAVLLVSLRKGTLAWAVFITLATLIPAPNNYRLLIPMTFSFAVWVTRYYWRLSKCDSPFPWGACLFDTVVAYFWSLYMLTYFYYPEERGYRRSPKILGFLKRYFYNECVTYFSMKVICAPETNRVLDDPEKQFIFGYHPHGVYPGTAMYACSTQPWIEKLGCNSKTHVTCHVAGIVLNAPILRDFLMANGCRAVTHTGIERNLREGNSSLIVVGGQSDLLLTHRSETEQHYAIHHVGFIRIALRQRVPLVPVLNFTEHNIMDNVHWYAFQRLMLRLLRFPLLVIPVGRLHLPIPNQVPVTLAVGRPVPVPAEIPSDLAEFEELVYQTAEKYYQEVIRLFYTFRSQAAYPNMELFLHGELSDKNPVIKGSREYEKARTCCDRPFRFPRK